MSDAYTHSFNMNDGDLSPKAPGPADGVGSATMPSGTPDVTPAAPKGNADHVGEFSGMPDSSGDTMPKPPVIC